MDKVLKKRIIKSSIFILLFLSILISIFYIFYKMNQESPLYIAISQHDRSKMEMELPDGIVYEDNSGEQIFIDAINLYLNRDYSKAKSYFLSALDSRYYDPALPAYSYYFLDQCNYKLDQPADQEIIFKALEEISKYPPLSNNTAMLWDLFTSYDSLFETNEEMLLLMEDYLENAHNIDLATWAFITNNIAMYEYDNKEYAKSIRHFYDVETALSSTESTPDIQYQLICAKEYIANIHFAFKNYETAAELYQQIIEDNSDSESFDAYLSCTNLAACHLELSDPQKAREIIAFLESKLSQLPDYALLEIEASIHDIRANIALQESNYSEADHYLKLAEKSFDSTEDSAVSGSDYFIMLTRAKYYVALKEFDKALPLLLDMLATEEVIAYGFEPDIYELLKTIYSQTGENHKLIQVYEKLISMNVDFENDIQREYLEFSTYYKENNKLKTYNMILTRRSTISILVIFIFCLTLIIVVFILNVTARRNLTDQLTGVYNRKKLNRLIRQYNRFGTPGDLAVIMMDIDYFKKYNDTYGHPEGDKALKKVSKILLSCVRSKDIVIRYGGEEFLLLAHDVSAEVADTICKRINQQINEAAIPHQSSEVSDHVTLSIGVCHQKVGKTMSFEALVEEADQCLYQSKKNGRNQFNGKYV